MYHREKKAQKRRHENRLLCSLLSLPLPNAKRAPELLMKNILDNPER